MPRLPRKLTVALFISAVGILVTSLWLGLRFFAASSNRSQSEVCEEWERAEVADQGLGWDLSYMSVLTKFGLCPGEPLCEVWAKPKPLIDKHFTEWQGDPIISSIEIELPDGHAGMAIMWLIRTKNHAYYWALHSSALDNIRSKQPISAQHYDSAFEAMACWRQDEPPNKSFGDKGYIGFLSLYKERKSRQMLLTHNDLFAGNSNPDDGKPGRFWIALRPLVASMREQQPRGVGSK